MVSEPHNHLIGMLPDVIDTDRFTLRPFRAEDVDAVYAYGSDDEFLRYLPIALPYTRATTQTFLAKQAALDRGSNPSWAVAIDDEPCGGVNIRFSAEHRLAEIGYAVARTCWGQGIATEMARLVIGLAFQHHSELMRVAARADARNIASIRVMEKLGMQREGLLRSSRVCRGELTDEVRYAVLRSEWRKDK